MPAHQKWIFGNWWKRTFLDYMLRHATQPRTPRITQNKQRQNTYFKSNIITCHACLRLLQAFIGTALVPLTYRLVHKKLPCFIRPSNIGAPSSKVTNNDINRSKGYATCTLLTLFRRNIRLQQLKSIVNKVNVVSGLRCHGIFNDHFVANLLLSATKKEYWNTCSHDKNLATCIFSAIMYSFTRGRSCLWIVSTNQQTDNAKYHIS